MRAAKAQYRPAIQNGEIGQSGALLKRRSRTPQLRITKNRTVSAARRPVQPRVTRPTRRRAKALPVVRPNGMHVFGLLALAGALLSLVLVTALHWQRATLQYGIQEVELRSALDQTQNEGRKLLIEQSRALSPRETEQRGRQLGQAPVKLEERGVVLRSAKVEAKTAKPKVNGTSKPSLLLSRVAR